MKSIFTKLAVVLTSFIFITACDENEPAPDNSTTEVLENYANLVYANYDDVVKTAQSLSTAIDDFTTAPTTTNLEKARKAWLAARSAYGQTEGFRFYGGPIDNDEGPEGLINGWPLDESYIDYVVGNPNSGIINDVVAYPAITRDLLVSLNENGSETNLSTGYHAIEFLLWGQDFNADGPGDRPVTDYIAAQNTDRREQYLKVVTELLIDNLTEVREAWKLGAPYRTNFIAGEDDSIAKVFRGIGALSKGELAGERMTVALANQDQEDEHSCFSDNTHEDIRMNFLSIKNVYMGTYQRVDGSIVSGKSLADLVKAKNAEKNTAVQTLLKSVESSVYAIPVPFDKAISNGDPSKNIEKSILGLRRLSDSIVDAALSLGIQVNADLD